MQKRKHSVLEAVLNTASGFIISMALGPIIFPWFGFHPTVVENFWIVFAYTVVSVIRSYIWRRTFVWLHVNGWLQ